MHVDSLRRSRWVRAAGLAAALALAPAGACANGLIPALTAYREAGDFYFLFGMVVLLESLFFRLWLKRPSLGGVLWRMLVANAVSSLAGLLLMRSRWRPEFTAIWAQAIPFFVLTLLVEAPTIMALFRGYLRSWRQALQMAVAANIISYAVLIAAARPIERLWLDGLAEEDGRVLRSWTNTALLAEAPGVIYGANTPEDGLCRLSRFDAQNGRWHRLTNCPPLNPMAWDAEGDLLACVSRAPARASHDGVSLFRLPDFEPLGEIALPRAGKIPGIVDLSLSPDRRKLAVLIPHHEITASLRGASYRCHGVVCDLLVYDTESGHLLGTSPRRAFGGGICWLPDSATVLFPSLRLESWLALERLDREWQSGHPDAERTLQDAPLYAFDLTSGAVTLFRDSPERPCLAAAGNALLFRKGRTLLALHDLGRNETRDIAVGPLGYRGITVSPDGRHAIVPLTLKHPLGYLGHQTLVDLRDPSRRHYLVDFSYRLDWTAAPTQPVPASIEIDHGGSR